MQPIPWVSLSRLLEPALHTAMGGMFDLSFRRSVSIAKIQGISGHWLILSRALNFVLCPCIVRARDLVPIVVAAAIHLGNLGRSDVPGCVWSPLGEGSSC